MNNLPPGCSQADIDRYYEQPCDYCGEDHDTRDCRIVTVCLFCGSHTEERDLCRHGNPPCCGCDRCSDERSEARAWWEE